MTDLAHSVRKVAVLPEMLGALVVLVVGVLGGLTSGRDVVALLVHRRRRARLGVRGHVGLRSSRADRAWLPLALFVVVLTPAVACSGLAPSAAGPLGRGCTR